MNFMKRGKTWTVRVSWRDSNSSLRQKSKGGFATKQSAKKYGIELETKIQNGTMIDKISVAFSDYFDEWYKTYKVPKLTTQTINRYKIISRLIRENFRKTKIDKITRRSYQKFINDFGSTHAKDTVRKTNTIIRACIKNAILDDVLIKDFTQNIELVFDKSKEVKVEYLNLEELQKLTNGLIMEIDRKFTSRYMILTAIYTGMRLGEIMALTWEDINFNWKTISINKAWDYFNGGGFKETKNESSKRIIRVNQNFLSILEQLKKNNKTMVFENQFGTIPTSNAVNKTLRDVMKSVDLKKNNFHFHSLRHSHVAYLLSQNIDLYSISKRLGHSDIQTTSRVYAYLLNEHKAKLDDKIEYSLDNLICATNVQQKEIK